MFDHESTVFSRPLEPSTALSPTHVLESLNHPLRPEPMLKVGSYSSSSTLNQAEQEVFTKLSEFASSQDYNTKMNLAFGTQWNVEQAQGLLQEWAASNFSNIPKTEILYGEDILGANGAFSGETNAIYLSNSFLNQNADNPDVVTSVLLEEIGHAIDFRINKTDAAGDEGDIFSRLVRGEVISAKEFLELKAENDHAIINFNGKSIEIEMSQIGMTSLNSVLYQSHQGTDNQIYTRSTANGVNWTDWNKNGGGSTYSATALTTLDGNIYQAHRGTDNKIYTRASTDGLNWTDWNNDGGGETYSAPAMAMLNGNIYQAHRGTDNNLYIRSSADGVNWIAWNSNGGGSTHSAPALATLDDKLYESHRGTDNKIYTRWTANGVSWTNWNNNGGGETYNAPALAVFDGKLYQTHRGTDSKIYTRSSTDGMNWNDWSNVGGGETPDAPSLVASHGRLYQSHQGMNNKIYTRWTSDGTNWTSWTENGGLTPTENPAPIVGKSDIKINFDFLGAFTTTQMDLVRKAVDNWERIITRDKDFSGVLKIAVTKTSTYGIDGRPWGQDWAEAYRDTAPNARTNFELAGIDNPAAGIDYHNRINFNSAKLSDSNWVRNSLVKTVMHELGHTLGLGHEDRADSMMDSPPDPKITDASWDSLSKLGYSFDRNAAINWS